MKILTNCYVLILVGTFTFSNGHPTGDWNSVKSAESFSELENKQKNVEKTLGSGRKPRQDDGDDGEEAQGIFQAAQPFFEGAAEGFLGVANNLVQSIQSLGQPPTTAAPKQKTTVKSNAAVSPAAAVVAAGVSTTPVVPPTVALSTAANIIITAPPPPPPTAAATTIPPLARSTNVSVVSAAVTGPGAAGVPIAPVAPTQVFFPTTTDNDEDDDEEDEY